METSTEDGKVSEGLHNDAQMLNKKFAIREAAARFAHALKGGALNDDAILHHEIESLAQLVEEYKRG